MGTLLGFTYAVKQIRVHKIFYFFDSVVIEVSHQVKFKMNFLQNKFNPFSTNVPLTDKPGSWFY